MGNAAFLTASFAIIAKEFPDNVATTFVSINSLFKPIYVNFKFKRSIFFFHQASLETFFGLGLIVGPTVGGALYEVIY